MPIILVDIGNFECHSDGGGIFANFAIRKKFEKKNIPNPNCLPGTSVYFPYYFAAHDAILLKIGIIKPYPGKLLPHEQQIFNYRLHRAMACVENVYGILAIRCQTSYRMINGVILCEDKHKPNV